MRLSQIIKALKQVASAIDNAREYAQAVIDTLTESRWCMSDKYGFGGGIELPKVGTPHRRPAVDQTALTEAVQAGRDLGFVNREPGARRKPGPKRTEPQDKVSIPGPKRIIDAFRAFCTARDVTFWEGLEMLLEEQNARKK